MIYFHPLCSSSDVPGNCFILGSCCSKTKCGNLKGCTSSYTTLCRMNYNVLSTLCSTHILLKIIPASGFKLSRENESDWPLGFPSVVASNLGWLHDVLNKQTHQQVSTIQNNRHTFQKTHKSPVGNWEHMKVWSNMLHRLKFIYSIHHG